MLLFFCLIYECRNIYLTFMIMKELKYYPIYLLFAVGIHGEKYSYFSYSSKELAYNAVDVLCEIFPSIKWIVEEHVLYIPKDVIL